MAKTYADLTVANATAGNAILATDFSTLFTNSNGFRRPPVCVVARSAQASMTSGTKFAFTSSAEVDTESPSDPMHSTSTNNTRVTVRTAGIYVVSGFLSFPANATNGLRAAVITKNNVAVANNSIPQNGTYNLGSTPIYVGTAAVGDYFELRIDHDIGTGVTADGRLQVLWIGQAS